MSDTVSGVSELVNEWLSVEAAAIRLGISSRSIARRVQSGQLESRVDANGRRSVLVCVPAPKPAAPPKPEPHVIPAEVTAALSAVDQAAEASGQTRAIVQQAMSVVIRSHEETMMAAREDAWSARRSMRRAWAAVAVLVVGAGATVGIVAHNMTAANDLVRQANQRVEQSDRTVKDVTAQRDALQDQIVQAKVHEATAQGELKGQLSALTTAAQKPTTAPTSLQRFASAFFGE